MLQRSMFALLPTPTPSALRNAFKLVKVMPYGHEVDAQGLIDTGSHKLCSCGTYIIRVDQTACRACSSTQTRAHRNVRAQPTPVARQRKDGPHTADATIPEYLLGGFSALEDQTLWLIVPGVPVSQGSMRAVAPGVVKREKGTELLAWRAAIHRALVAQVGTEFAAANCPIRVHVCLTMPALARTAGVRTSRRDTGDDRGEAATESPRTAPDTRPDIDKLIRAVGDSMSPIEKWRTRAYVDDGRIVEVLSAKSFPSPEHVHPWALPYPGAVIRVCPVHIEPSFPLVRLSAPAPPPKQVEHFLAAHPNSHS